MTMNKVADGSSGPTPWPAKVLKFNAAAGTFEAQGQPQEVKCGTCAAQMVKDGQGVIYCPDCKAKEDVR